MFYESTQLYGSKCVFIKFTLCWLFLKGYFNLVTDHYLQKYVWQNYKSSNELKWPAKSTCTICTVLCACAWQKGQKVRSIKPAHWGSPATTKSYRLLGIFVKTSHVASSHLCEKELAGFFVRATNICSAFSCQNAFWALFKFDSSYGHTAFVCDSRSGARRCGLWTVLCVRT